MGSRKISFDPATIWEGSDGLTAIEVSLCGPGSLLTSMLEPTETLLAVPGLGSGANSGAETVSNFCHQVGSLYVEDTELEDTELEDTEPADPEAGAIPLAMNPATSTGAAAVIAIRDANATETPPPSTQVSPRHARTARDGRQEPEPAGIRQPARPPEVAPCPERLYG